MLRQLLARTGLPRTPTGNALDDSEELGREEFKLPKMASLIIIIVHNIMLQYAEYLGGNATFSGIIIDIPSVFSALTLIPMTRCDRGQYATALHIGCFAAILGQVAYAIAYCAKFLYLILIGRCLTGVSFSNSVYCKRYSTDPLVVGIRRRVTLSSWLVIGQALGMTLGPFLGGVLYKVGFHNDIFNGYTSLGWVMAGCYVIFWLIMAKYFEDVPTTPEMSLELQEIAAPASSVEEKKRTGGPSIPSPSARTTHSQPLAHEESITVRFTRITRPQWGVIICMCWFSMLWFFVLGSWEANLPVFGTATSTLNWSPFAAGNIIALGGIAAFPCFLVNLLFARRVQDRHLLTFGSCFRLCGLLISILLLVTSKVVYGLLFACWWIIALGFNLATTVTLSLLSKQLPPQWNRRTSMAIQYSNYVGRLAGAIWGGSGVAVGMTNFVGLEIGFVGIGGVLFTMLWRNLNTKTG